ncbi:MAG: hypothetical protein HUJ86_06960 [Synergistes sp.]|nr:hypothetical protein [Synergistes sp.]
MKKLFYIAAILLLTSLPVIYGDAISADTKVPEQASESDKESQERAAYTKYAEYTPVKAVPQKLIQGSDSKILVAYLSRSGNTALPKGVEAVSSASLKIGKDGKPHGNAEQIAEWIAEETGGDLFLIQTEYTYPIDYDTMVDVGEGQDIDGYRPKLSSHLRNPEQYDKIFLVYPLWHYSLPVPVCSFLEEYDFSGKTIYAFATHAGSGFSDTVSRIRDLQPNSAVTNGIAIHQKDIDSAKSILITNIRELLRKTPEVTKPEKEKKAGKKIKLQIGPYSFTATPEDNAAVREFTKLLKTSPITIQMEDYSGFEKVGALGRNLPAENSQITASAGDIVLYNGSNIVIFYGSNSWSYTRLAKIDNLTDWKKALERDSINVTFSIE